MNDFDVFLPIKKLRKIFKFFSQVNFFKAFSIYPLCKLLLIKIAVIVASATGDRYIIY